MAPWLIIPVRMLGLAAAGFALGAGWKLGSHVVDIAMGKKDLLWPRCGENDAGKGEGEALWRRKHSRITEED